MGLVGSPTSPRQVNNLIHKDIIFRPAQIRNTHNQLRHLASAPDSRTVYYVSLKDVYKIDLVDNVKRHVSELPFDAKCMATGCGFLCAADESGAIVSMRIPEGAKDHLDELEEVARDRCLDDGPREQLASIADINRSSPQLRPRITQPGNDIVNSVSIHQITPPVDYPTNHDVIVVSTNNDKRLRMLSLRTRRHELIDEFIYPMNHASVSPDGKYLVVVGDYDLIHFYKRVDTRRPTDRKGFVNVDGWFRWVADKVLQLSSGPQFDSLAFFTTAWNETGSLCATASEGGYVTLFDVDKVKTAQDSSDAQSCIVAYLPSSRPQTAAGAVRSMQFAPAPFHHLIWAENYGRICIVDLSPPLVIERQTVKLDGPRIHVDLITAPPSPSTSPRLGGYSIFQGPPTSDPSEVYNPEFPNRLSQLPPPVEHRDPDESAVLEELARARNAWEGSRPGVLNQDFWSRLPRAVDETRALLEDLSGRIGPGLPPEHIQAIRRPHPPFEAPRPPRPPQSMEIASAQDWLSARAGFLNTRENSAAEASTHAAAQTGNDNANNGGPAPPAFAPMSARATEPPIRPPLPRGFEEYSPLGPVPQLLRNPSTQSLARANALSIQNRVNAAREARLPEPPPATDHAELPIPSNRELQAEARIRRYQAQRERTLRWPDQEFERLVRTTGRFAGAALNTMTAQETAMHRRVYALSSDPHEAAGMGTAGVMIPPLPESDFDGLIYGSLHLTACTRPFLVAGEEGLLQFQLNFEGRKYGGATEFH